jgi:hypothetical protein
MTTLLFGVPDAEPKFYPNKISFAKNQSQVNDSPKLSIFLTMSIPSTTSPKTTYEEQK